VGDRCRPKSAGIVRGGIDEQGHPTRGKGCGSFDPATGLYEWYEDVPEEETGGTPVEIKAVMNRWAVVEPLFHETFGVDLSEVLHTKSWRWFMVRVGHLLSTQNRLSALFSPDSE
jgi:hypothetical protein